jgi:methylated-DNA-[protein]-cysteine S-methyltransferase
MRTTVAVRTSAAYDVLESPLGPLFAATTTRGLCTLAFGAEVALEASEASRRLGMTARRYPEQLLDVRYQLEEYFAGRRTAFDLALDLRLASPFGRRVLEATSGIGFGSVATYGEVAHRAGVPKAARAVGQALNRNPVAIIVPCHRVVGSAGNLTGYGGGLERKEALLALEGARWASTVNTSPN